MTKTIIQTNGLVLLVFLVGVAQISSAGEELAQSVYLDPTEKFHLLWSFTDDDITFTMTVNTTGWFGLGFSENGGMSGADIIVAGVKDGEPYLWDMYATSNSQPMEDPKQNIILVSGAEKDGQTAVTFKRKHITCDPNHDHIIREGTMRLIYASSPDNSDVLFYHSPSFRGARSIYLQHNISPVNPNTPDDAVILDLRVTEVHPLIKEESLGLVQRIVLYGCYDTVDREDFFTNDNTVHDCASNPDLIAICSAPITVWAIGGESMYFPDEAGLPLNGDADSPRYLMMEIHYDNPPARSGYTDNSGLRLVLTPTLRPNDAGILPTGAIDGIAIPPGQEDFIVTGFCTDECITTAFTEPANVFGSLLHGHSATRQIIVRQFRDKDEIEVFDSDRHYDFNYQQYRMFSQSKQLKPGDDIMVSCHYNTQTKDSMTYGGQGSSSEVCVAYLFYYPAQNLGDCFTFPRWSLDPSFVSSTFGFSEQDGTYQSMFDKAVTDGLWTEENINLLQKAYVEEYHGQWCFNRTKDYLYSEPRGYVLPIAAEQAELTTTAPEHPICVITTTAGVTDSTVSATTVSEVKTGTEGITHVNTDSTTSKAVGPDMKSDMDTGSTTEANMTTTETGNGAMIVMTYPRLILIALALSSFL